MTRAAAGIGPVTAWAFVQPAERTPEPIQERNKIVIHAVYRWRVEPGEESQFVQAWAEGTRVIRAQVKGAGGSLLLRQRQDPTVFMGVAQWESFEDWQAFSADDPPAPEAFKRAADISTLVAIEVFEEIQDLVIDND